MRTVGPGKAEQKHLLKPYLGNDFVFFQKMQKEAREHLQIKGYQNTSLPRLMLRYLVLMNGRSFHHFWAFLQHI